MNNVFFYTFRTNKFVGEIERVLGQEIYIVDKYAKDFDDLVDAINFSGAVMVVGIGISKRYTRFETRAYNRLGRYEILKGGPDKLSLSVPKGSSMKKDTKMTFGPCNYVAYRLSVTLTDNKHYFIHIKSDDIEKLQAEAF